MNIKLSAYVRRSIISIASYIAGEGYPETAFVYISWLKQFLLSLTVFPSKYPLCRHKQFAKRNFYCAVFEGTYVIVYKVDQHSLYIYHIIHGSRLA